MTSESAAARQAALDGIKLRSLVSARWGAEDREPAPFGFGAALLAPSDDGPQAWLYLARPEGRRLGAALVWAERYDVRRLHILVDPSPDDDPGRLARQAAYFARPDLGVWRIEGPSSGDQPGGHRLVEAAPAPFPERGQPAPAATELVDALIDAGTEVVVEDGIVRGEVNGLEVARIVHGQTTAGVPLDGPLLEIGVGAADRELTAMLHGELSSVEQLARAVGIVRQHRRSEAPHHPLNRLAPERWLRAALVRSPGTIGLSTLRPADNPRPRTNLRERGIAAGQGATAADGRSVVVVCSVGIDVELVPAAADARAFLDPSAELWLVVPERDHHPTTRRLASRLRPPAEVVPVSDGWRGL